MLKLVTVAIVVLAVVAYFGFNQFGPKVTTPQELNPQYDYIIVGGGTAGCILAARLSEDPATSVLVLEAGGEEHELFYSHIPGSAVFLQMTDMDWQFLTVPQTKCCSGLKDNQGTWPHGKVLGGSSVLNLMNYVRGKPGDFDHWADLGNEGWSYKDVLPYFKKSEKIEIDRLKSSDFHGHDGPIGVTENTDPSKLGKSFVEAADHLGYPLVEDYNGGPDEGFSSIQFTIHKGKRISTASHFLRPAMSRSNLHVVTRAHVTKIAFEYNDKDKKATGVEYLHGGKKHRVLVNKEVVLSAGAVQSPHILMLSGIGPRAQLEKFGIHTIQDLSAVGQNMKDHIGLHCRFSMNESTGVDMETYTSFMGFLKMGYEYVVKGSGPLAVPPVDYFGFIKSRLVKSKVPELQLYIMGVDPFIEDFPKYLNLGEDAIRSLQVTEEGRFPFAAFPLILHPRSSGEVTLQSSDPTIPPLIDPKYFHDELDLDILVDGMKVIEEILAAPQMKKYDIRHFEEPLTVCAKFIQWSNDYLRCLARSRSTTTYHPVSTCRMGVSHEDSVVDSELRVHGVKGLRIADASIFPDHVSGNTYAAVMMVAEKAADLIKNSK